MVQIKLILYFLTYFFNKIHPTSYTRWGRWSLLPEWKIEWGTSVGSTGSWYWRRFFSWPRQVDLKWFDATKTYVPTRKYVRTGQCSMLDCQVFHGSNDILDLTLVPLFVWSAVVELVNGMMVEPAETWLFFSMTTWLLWPAPFEPPSPTDFAE